jgi:hypothetical protein
MRRRRTFCAGNDLSRRIVGTGHVPRTVPGTGRVGTLLAKVFRCLSFARRWDAYELDSVLEQAVRGWIAREWPFARVSWPGR